MLRKHEKVSKLWHSNRDPNGNFGRGCKGVEGESDGRLRGGGGSGKDFEKLS